VQSSAAPRVHRDAGVRTRRSWLVVSEISWAFFSLTTTADDDDDDDDDYVALFGGASFSLSPVSLQDFHE
jgi:hypothetical protein